MSGRDLIFGNIRAALKDLPEKTAYPQWEDDLVVTQNHPAHANTAELFQLRLQAVHGVYLQGLEAVADWLKAQGLLHGYVEPDIFALKPQLWEGLEVETQLDRSRIDEYTFGVTRASGAIAETGTVILKDRETQNRLAALAPWTHVAVVESSKLYENIPQALRELGDDPSVIWATGPSKTADIEGIMIQGVHGPGVQVACLIG